MLALLVALAGPPPPAAAQPAPTQPRSLQPRPPRPASPPPRVHPFNARRLEIHRGGMAVLTGYSLLNIGLGLGLGLTQDGPARHFHQMNAYWNTVNLALGVAGLVGVRREDRTLALPAAMARARKHQSLFTWNAALDVLYVTTGAVLFNAGQDRDHGRMLGYGAAIMLQGGFLFAFDLTLAALHARNIRRFSGTVAGAPIPGGVVLGLRGAF